MSTCAACRFGSDGLCEHCTTWMMTDGTTENITVSPIICMATEQMEQARREEGGMGSPKPKHNTYTVEQRHVKGLVLAQQHRPRLLHGSPCCCPRRRHCSIGPPPAAPAAGAAAAVGCGVIARPLCRLPSATTLLLRPSGSQHAPRVLDSLLAERSASARGALFGMDA